MGVVMTNRGVLAHMCLLSQPLSLSGVVDPSREALLIH